MHVTPQSSPGFCGLKTVATVIAKSCTIDQITERYTNDTRLELEEASVSPRDSLVIECTHETPLWTSFTNKLDCVSKETH